ncbi:flagellar hook protein FlgE [Bacillus sp. H-16]|uniref:flagellar hook protein FlgE n=1 Tax=Alteribacter salitolerans TaxID=2912333 RepID=UPI00196337DD|nr:flagellar hook protein FlgE [Alteribacter salitolerans]MBM7094179.1 flagellar hook protein FlgE [Alteribacter salitolerans]
MIRSMYAGIGGMKNFQTKLDVIGNNISNVNTHGFKSGRATFQDLVSQQLSGASTAGDNRGGRNPQQVGLGTTLSSIDSVQTQGSIQSTGRDLDLGISGDGFFIAADGNQNYYTRAGNFYLDQQGNLVNSEGMRIQGYPADGDGVIDDTQLGNLLIQSGAGTAPQATENATLRGNLNAEGDIGAARPMQFLVYDELGRTHSVPVEFVKTGDNSWSVTVNQATTQLNFASGQLGDDATMEVQLPLGDAADIEFQLDFSQLTQYASPSNVEIDEVDGNQEGVLESYSISSSGEINGVFSNGDVRLLGQIATANFNNPAGLTKAGSNMFQVSNNSGNPQVGVPGNGGRGELMVAGLEMSNVDLSQEFAEMIVSQRGFQANTRMITTSDELLQELVNLKR